MEKDNTKKVPDVQIESVVPKAEKVSGRAIDKYQGVYILKPCKKTWIEQLDKKHDGAYLFSEAAITLSPERDKDTGVIKTGLSTQEQAELEAEMGLKPMELSPYSKFWNDFKMYPKVSQGGLTLDLNRSAADKMKYLFCKVNSKVALSSLDVLENPRAEVLMTSVEKEAQVDSSKIRTKLEAMKKLAQMNISDQIDFLRVYNEGRYKVSNSATPDFIMSTIGKVADEESEKFLDLIGNPDYKTMLLIQEAISVGAIKKSGVKYFASGGDLIGNGLADCIANLSKPEYNEVKISIKAKIDAIK